MKSPRGSYRFERMRERENKEKGRGKTLHKTRTPHQSKLTSYAMCVQCVCVQWRKYPRVKCEVARRARRQLCVMHAKRVGAGCWCPGWHVWWAGLPANGGQGSRET